MGQALYRKYRSKKLNEVIGQDHIVKTLNNSLKSGKISHAYLLTGPKGVGKTSVARILAHEVNGFSYDDAQHHLDIIEIDAASNRRIDEIRDLREKVNIAPSFGKYKVYIIDEVHMLTKEAFNALLKTLEEPPEHAIFILATTEASKLPATIVSRTQRFSFKPIDHADLIKHLSDIAKKEGFKVEPEALDIIAHHSEGSFRDGISLLDQAGSGQGAVTLSSVQQLLGIAPHETIENLVTLLGSSSPKVLLEQLAELRQQGYSSAGIAKQINEVIRKQLINDKLLLPKEKSLDLLKNLIEVPASQSPDRLLEVVLVGLTLDHADSDKKSSLEQVKSEQPEPAKVVPSRSSKPAETQNSLKKQSKPMNLNIKLWPAVLATIKSRHNTLYGLLRMAEPSIDESKLILSFNFPFHQKKVDEASNRQIIMNAVASQYSGPVEIITVVNKNTKPPKADNNVETLTNIFGGAEVLDF